MRLAFLILLFAAFTTYSIAVSVQEGYFGFLHLALRERWGMQILLDLTIGLAVCWVWLFPDARARGLNPWPYFLVTLPLGSIGVLAYLIRRELGGKRAHVAIPQGPSTRTRWEKPTRDIQIVEVVDAISPSPKKLLLSKSRSAARSARPRAWLSLSRRCSESHSAEKVDRTCRCFALHRRGSGSADERCRRIRVTDRWACPSSSQTRAFTCQQLPNPKGRARFSATIETNCADQSGRKGAS